MIKKGQRKSLTTTPAKINNVQLLPRRRRNCSRGRGRIAAATPPRPNLGVLLVNPTVKQHQKGEGMGGRKEQKKKRKKTQKIIPKTERYRERKKRKNSHNPIRKPSPLHPPIIQHIQHRIIQD